MEEKTIQIAGSITVDELSKALGLSVTDLIGTLFKNGIVATINQRLDYETASIITMSGNTTRNAVLPLIMLKAAPVFLT